MAKDYPIRTYPDPVLRKETSEITDFNEELGSFVSEMQRLMFENDGVGLAGPQIGFSLKIAIVYYEERLYTLINPVIIESSGEEYGEEGCLSFPGIYGRVKRPEKIRIKAQDINGTESIFEAEGFLARAFCHETDHLNGILLIDHFSPMKKNMVKRKMLKKSRETQ